jgi:hypothetical protein
MFSFFFFWKTNKKSLIFFSRTPVQLIVNNIFFCFFKKISLMWIKFTRTVMKL